MGFRTLPKSELGCDDTANIIETVQWPYDEDDLLRHIDNEELPPTFIDIFETHYSHLFYSGCIIAEIRDYRQAYPLSNCDIHHVLLRPTLKVRTEFQEISYSHYTLYLFNTNSMVQ